RSPAGQMSRYLFCLSSTHPTKRRKYRAAAQAVSMTLLHLADDDVDGIREPRAEIRNPALLPGRPLVSGWMELGADRPDRVEEGDVANREGDGGVHWLEARAARLFGREHAQCDVVAVIDEG